MNREIIGKAGRGKNAHRARDASRWCSVVHLDAMAGLGEDTLHDREVPREAGAIFPADQVDSGGT
jgi:hypothetical protein